jgi:hypothetical protein
MHQLLKGTRFDSPLLYFLNTTKTLVCWTYLRWTDYGSRGGNSVKKLEKSLIFTSHATLRAFIDEALLGLILRKPFHLCQ